MKTRPISTGLKKVLEEARYNPVAAFNAATIMEEEHRGQSAIQYFYRRSALGGYVPAMWRMAGFLLTGQYIMDEDDEQDRRCADDLQEGIGWLQLAAKTGDSTSCYLLARCYIDGVGVKRDIAEARQCLSKVIFYKYINPYVATEALVFGSVSHQMAELVRQVMELRVLTAVG